MAGKKVGKYDITYYPSPHAQPDVTASTALGIAEHTGNPVVVTSHPPTSDPDVPMPNSFTVCRGANPGHLRNLAARLFQF